MAKKTYRTFFLKGLTLLLSKANGERVEVVFRKGIQVDSTAKYTTYNKDVQEALEKCSGFGRDYYIESVVEDAPVTDEAPEVITEAPVQEPEPLTDMKDVRRFHNLVEMKNAMTELGMKDVQGLNYLQCKSLAAKEGYDFQIQK